MEYKLRKIFNKDKNIIIGAIHFAPLFGYKDFSSYQKVLQNSLEDLSAFENGGVDGIIIENNYDVPHKIIVEKETVEMMMKLGKEIKNKTKLPIGVSVLWNDYKSALLISKNIGAKFSRVPVFVDSVETNYGKVFADPEAVLKFRKEIGDENIALLTDIHVKHSKLLDNKLIEDSAKEAIKRGSDALIVTGKWTGDAPDLSDLKKVKKIAGNFPILIGSGVDKDNVKELFKYSNGAIVSTSVKEGYAKKGETNVKTWEQRISIEKVRKLVEKICLSLQKM